jgi:hypothetical protein
MNHHKQSNKADNMKNISKSAGLVAAIVSLVCAGSVNADTVTVVIGGGAQSGANYVNFDSLPGASTASYTSGGLTVSFAGNARTDLAPGANTAAAPWLSVNNNVNFESPSALPVGGQADTTTFLATGNNSLGGVLTFNFTSAQNYFGLLWGSIDYSTGNNILKFYSGANGTGSLVSTVTGADLAALNSAIDKNLTSEGSQDITGTAYVNINTTLGFESVVATSANFTFEMDNIAYGTSVPDGGMTVGLLGMALVGMSVIRRKLAK